LVVVDEPKTSPYGGVVAAPAFSAIAQQSLAYLHVAPTQARKIKPGPVEVRKAEPAQLVAADDECAVPESGGRLVMANFRGMSMRQVLQLMERRGLNVKLLGSGRVVEQNPPPGNRITPADQVWVRLAPSA
jgi:cell division protein FtsI (penicillin-binding protein 3)